MKKSTQPASGPSKPASTTQTKGRAPRSQQTPQPAATSHDPAAANDAPTVTPAAATSARTVPAGRSGAATDIVIRGAREHNLQDVSLSLPRNQLIVMTGVSGSGKSSLAFDTLYAEGQRRYIESLSTYARQFLGQMPKPDVDAISGLAPSISIQQKTAGRNPRSTVGTITEVYDYLRVLFARVGQPRCHQCGSLIQGQTRDQMIDAVLALPVGTRFEVLAPLVTRQKGEFRDLFADLVKQGYLRARVDGRVVSLTDDLRLEKQMKHTIELVIDRLVSGPTIRGRLAEAVENALRLANGKLIISQTAAGTAGSQPQDQAASRSKSRSSRPVDEDLPEPSTAANAEPATIDRLFSADYACAQCGISYEPPSPQLFSFNSPQGMCLDCNGLGMRHDFLVERILSNPKVSLAKGAFDILGPVTKFGRWRRHLLDGVARVIELECDLKPGTFIKTAWEKLPEAARLMYLRGLGERVITYSFKHSGGVWKHTGTFPGLIAELLEDYRKTKNPMRRRQLEKYMDFAGCSTCRGSRLNVEAANYFITSTEPAFVEQVRSGESLGLDAGQLKRRGGSASAVPLSLPEVCSLSTLAAAQFFSQLELTPAQQFVAEEVLKEIRGRLGFLLRCGLDYLTLDRTAPTLSGGETQRIRLAGQIGCGLVGVVYILDEPSIGLHPRDNEMLLGSLCDLRDQGNTVIVVEHDEDTMRAADHIVDFGPGPGVRGGRVVAEGRLDDVKASIDSVTGAFLSGRRTIPIPAQRRAGLGKSLRVEGARHHNLRDVTVDFPLGKLIVVTGVSGSGKSSLVNDVLWHVLNRELNGGEGQPGEHTQISGLEHVDKAIDIDQSPIGRTPRSNPATYVKLFDLIRDLYTQLPESRTRGFKPGRFSFNVSGGRCEACEGNGSNKLEMDFLADIWITCPVCQGRRFNKETLEVRYKGKSIADVLEMDVQQALVHFENHPKIKQLLQTLHDVGLDYIKLGQPSPTLSGGEAQRIKLAKELGKRSTGKTVYILDEPTTGLHFVDIEHLLNVLHGFVDRGNTVIVIEHNLDVIKTADWLIDLGPEGGSGGGRLLAEGTPEDLACCAESYTGRALARLFANQPTVSSSPTDGRGKKGKRKAGSTADDSASRQATMKSVARLTSGPRWQTAANMSEQTAAQSSVVVRGASQHNLQHVDIEIPRGQMSVFSGPSGSGKTSLAMDTLYAEGQRRYVESLSSYARQFLGQMPKPRVEHIHGLQPAIAIEQKTVGSTPRSTVGTVTEIYDYFRVLFARLGGQHCPDCGIPVAAQTIDDVIEQLIAGPADQRLLVLAPLEIAVGQQYPKLWERLREQGFRRVRVDGQTYPLDEVPEVDRRRKHQIEVVLDRLTPTADNRRRVADSIEAAFDLGRGVIRVATADENRDERQWKVETFSLFRACQKCGTSFEELAPHHFSFNSPLGWCPSCEGLGTQQGTNLQALLGDPSRSLLDGAVTAWPDPQQSALFRRMLESLAAEFGLPLDQPFSQLDLDSQQLVLHGSEDHWIELRGEGETRTNGGARSSRKAAAASQSAGPSLRFQYKGLFPALEEAARLSYDYRHSLSEMVGEVPCSDCRGSRLRRDATHVRLRGKTLQHLCDLPLDQALTFLDSLKLSAAEKKIAGDLVDEARSRMRFLLDVGLHYLSLGRRMPTLSGGESQRIRLAGQLGRSLTGVLYVLDEPTIGLHPSDNGRLLQALARLRDLGNTVVLVEHDRDVIAAADRLYDFGPGAGRLGGRIVASGPPADLHSEPASLTGQFLSGREQITIPEPRRQPTAGWLELLGARLNNLRNVDLRIPLGLLTAITGVSGSGKSSLINETLAKAVAKRLHRSNEQPGPYDELLGLGQITKLIVVDQQPLGSTPASNPATYTGVFEEIRELFAALPEAKVRGYRPARFSFNRTGGRCEACEGNGQKCIEMHFLPDVWIECDVCHGHRYNADTLAVKFRGKSIADVLEMPISDALKLFENVPKIRGPLTTLDAIGLGYLTLGQSAPTLSGGEAQRVKLAAELCKPQSGQTLYLLDEPTTGLHFDDIRKLLKILQSLVEAGNTVVVIEHNLDVIKTTDWVIDIGPGGGSEGGWIVAQGSPEDLVEIARARQSALGLALDSAPRKARSKKAVATASDHATSGAATAAAVTSASQDALGADGRPLRSLTGEALADVLAAAVRSPREVFRRDAAFAKRAGDVNVRQLGEAVRMPWELDGRLWHTQTRLAHNGRQSRWDGSILETLADWFEGEFDRGVIDWQTRSVVEFTASGQPLTWFLHALTGDEWLLGLRFRVARNTFQPTALREQLQLKSLDDEPDIPVNNRGERVRISRDISGFQEVVIALHRASEIETPGFAKFLQTAIAAYRKLIAVDAASAVEQASPWKKLGRKWHLLQKGFGSGRVRWQMDVLEALEQTLTAQLPKLTLDWTKQKQVPLSQGSASVGRLVTKEPAALVLELNLPAGGLSIDALSDDSWAAEVVTVGKAAVTTLRLQLTTVSQARSPVLAQWLSEYGQKLR